MRVAVRVRDGLKMPIGEAKISVPDPRGAALGAAIVRADASGRHERQASSCTGRESLSPGETASCLPRMLGRPIADVDQPEPAFREQAHAAVTDPVGRVMGQAPTCLADWLRRHAAAFAPEASGGARRPAATRAG